MSERRKKVIGVSLTKRGQVASTDTAYILNFSGQMPIVTGGNSACPVDGICMAFRAIELFLEPSLG
jgi:hypothetical protein